MSSFAITIRPRHGIAPDTPLEKRLLKWFEKLTYSSVCFEKQDEARHLHAQVWYDEKDKKKGDLMKGLRDRICKDEIIDWDTSQKQKCVKICYAYNSWFENYCKDNEEKGEPTDIRWINAPLDELPYYPSEEEQSAIQAKANAADPRFYGYEEKWKSINGDRLPKDTYETAAFLFDLMFKFRTIPVVIDKKARCNIAECLYNYLIAPHNVEQFGTLVKVEPFVSKDKYEALVKIVQAQSHLHWVHT